MKSATFDYFDIKKYRSKVKYNVKEQWYTFYIN